MGLASALDLGLPWASLRAPIELGNGGATWFAITTPGNPDPAPVAEATEAIWEWVDAQVDPAAQVVPLGFSQGGLMASQLLRTRPSRVVAPVVLGGFVLEAPQRGDSVLARTHPAVFWGRGADDRVITGPAIERTRAFLPQHSALVERVYPGLAHGISAAEIEDVREFLVTEIGDGAAGAR
ncbi:phospholipase/carboxylesterase [mine drainage metagenome]|uniref:Phospholipase/carboxylesterase n=1 Tax=mine drainage metagenome TaxID=410659 RepID=A0A1J5Q8R5_9ZZZZ